MCWRNKEKSIIIADKDNINDFKDKVIEKIWLDTDKKYSPYEFYLRVLHEYFSVEYEKPFRTPQEITNGKFLDLKYQSDAIKMALSIIDKHNGVIISDVVGLGKSIRK